MQIKIIKTLIFKFNLEKSKLKNIRNCKNFENIWFVLLLFILTLLIELYIDIFVGNFIKKDLLNLAIISF